MSGDPILYFLVNNKVEANNTNIHDSFICYSVNQTITHYFSIEKAAEHYKLSFLNHLLKTNTYM